MIGKPVQGYKLSRPLISTSGVVGRTHLLHGGRFFQVFWAGFGWFLASSSLFFFVSLVFTFRFPMHLPRLPPVAGGMAMVFVDDLFLPLMSTSYIHFS